MVMGVKCGRWKGGRRARHKRPLLEFWTAGWVAAPAAGQLRQVGWMEATHDCCTCQIGSEHCARNGHAQFVQVDSKQYHLVK
eukprot:3618359-Amphidinium_carterae.1